MLHGFTGFWTGLFFYPYPDTVAYSEHLLGIAVFTAPAQWLTGNPIVALNLAMVASTALAGVGMFLLARDLTGRADAAVVAGVAFACTPYRLPLASHLQVLVSGWMPVALYGLHLAGAWRWIYVAATVLALYLNVFVGVVQAFQKLAFLQPFAPTQTEAPFIVAQVVVVAIFVVLGFLAVKRFHPQIA